MAVRTKNTRLCLCTRVGKKKKNLVWRIDPRVWRFTLEVYKTRWFIMQWFFTALETSELHHSFEHTGWHRTMFGLNLNSHFFWPCMKSTCAVRTATMMVWGKRTCEVKVPFLLTHCLQWPSKQRSLVDSQQPSKTSDGRKIHCDGHKIAQSNNTDHKPVYDGNLILA